MKKKTANQKRRLHLLLVASRKQLSRGDLRSLIRFLESENCEFDVTLQYSDPKEQPEILELHKLVAIPALIKIEPSPKQIFAGTAIFKQIQNWMPRWEEEEILISGLGINIRKPIQQIDITRKELLLEDENLGLRQENETLSNRVESQERLLRMVAHELRTDRKSTRLAVGHTWALPMVPEAMCNRG